MIKAFRLACIYKIGESAVDIWLTHEIFGILTRLKYAQQIITPFDDDFQLTHKNDDCE